MWKRGDLESRLTEWGIEYGGGKYEHIGWTGKSHLHGVMKWHGRPPDGLSHHSSTRADDVQLAIDTVQMSEMGPLLVSILCGEYLTPGLTLESRLQRQRKLGNNIAKSQYYVRLQEARNAVAECLGLT